ncbi:MAG: tRNA (guanosine(37)-N1)-methyltransferase TrmD [Polyangiaceae bacterium]|nr:tRNA (guanosine(37)-N1)-methyltransferase TrmD [Polyangiaceae bacterium]
MSDGQSFRVGVVTLFPDIFRDFLEISFVGKARKNQQLQVELQDLREFGFGKHQSVDDTPYGGGSGMVLRVDSVVPAIEACEEKLGGRAHRVLMSPQGKPLTASLSENLSRYDRLVLVCGRYEGFDHRVRDAVDGEISMGDFVLTGGEIPAMAVIEAALRFRPGVLGNHESVVEESFSDELLGGLEYPQYTRPLEWRGSKVPDILRSGDHQKIQAYRREESVRRTQEARPDLHNHSSASSAPGKVRQ